MMTFPNALIADDEPNILIPLEFLFKREGFEVELATRRKAARCSHPRTSRRLR